MSNLNTHPTPLPTYTTLYALGSNGNLQLGLPHNEDINAPQKCIFNITTLSTAQSTSTSNPSTTQTQNFIPLHLHETISTLSAGGNHTHILTTHGRIYAAGSNKYNELGLSPPSPTLSSATSTSSFPLPSSPVPPGFHHLPWTGPNPPSYRITHLTHTFTSTILVSSHTTLYTVGHGPKGELGLPDNITHAAVPTRIFDIRELEGDENARIESVAGCVDHVLVLSNSGVVYGFGSARRGKLGGGDENGDGICWGVKRTEMDVVVGRVRQVAVGREFSVVCGEGGEIAVFGRGFERERESGFNIEGDKEMVRGEGSISHQEEDQDENNDNVNHDHRSKSKSKSITFPSILHAGWSSLTLHNPNSTPQTSSLTGFLSSPHPTHDRGQLPPPLLSRVTNLAVGSEHTVALLEDGTVVAWGWGEHGNCGEMVDGRGVAGGGRWNVLWGGEGRGKGRVVGVGAGCGSSFFWVEGDGAGEEGGV